MAFVVFCVCFFFLLILFDAVICLGMTTVSLPSEDIGALVVDVGSYETRVRKKSFCFG